MHKILIIEDDQIIRENTKEILELNNYTVFEASNGKEGLNTAIKVLPDLILCDVMMPEMDGHAVLQSLNNKKQFSAIPFIFMTAKTDRSDIRKGMGLGADDYLTKPFDEHDLISSIEMRLSKSQKQEVFFKDKYMNNILQHTHTSDFIELKNKFAQTKIKKKQHLYSQDDQINHIYFLNSGSAKLYTINDDGKELIVDIIKPDCFFGTQDVFSSDKHLHNAITVKDSSVTKIPQKDFLQLVYNSPNIAKEFLSLLSKDVSTKDKKLLSMAYNSVRKRVADTLVQLSTKNDSNEIKMTRDELASYTGIATETFIRCLSELKDDKIIESKGRTITIIDRPALENYQY